MISKIEIYRFKRFKRASISLRASGVTIVSGPNNAGKSTLLHALAVWAFCRTVVEFERGRYSLNQGATRQGVGIGDDEFFPINVPSLSHLWTNLKTQKTPNDQNEPDGYTLRIRVFWTILEVEKFLEFGLALANDRLFIKCTATNLVDGDHIPSVAYLPPFAGITDKEARLSKADAAALIGQGLAGATIRNTLLDLYEQNLETRLLLKGDATKIPTKKLADLRRTDPWEKLSKVLEETFQYGLKLQEFNSSYHRYVKVEGYKGTVTNNRFNKIPSYIPRDLMVEGSGFLQWLSVFAFAVSPNIDVLLLDEPDAHLHVSLQADLVDQLSNLTASGKQVLMATHSVELLQRADHSQLLWVREGNAEYLNNVSQKIGLIAGLGSEYFPRLHSLTIKKKLLLVEGSFDEKILQILAQRSGCDWPKNVVVWKWNGHHKERKQLFQQLKIDIPGLQAISLRDRDDESLGSTSATLIDGSVGKNIEGLQCLKWPRRQLDNYLLVPTAIARRSGHTKQEVDAWLAQEHAVVIPDNHVVFDVPEAVKDHRCKEILYEKSPSIESVFGVSVYQIAQELTSDEVADDVKTFFEALNELAA